MAVLLNYTHPEMRIFIPATGEWIKFQRGKLEIDQSHPHYAVVMAEATRNPSIVVYESVTTCVWCGEVYSGKTAEANLARHMKDAHFDKYIAEKDQEAAKARMAEVKSREGFPCDLCPHATFPDEEALAAHVKVMHTQAPAMDAEGNDGGSKSTAAATVPAAKPSGK